MIFYFRFSFISGQSEHAAEDHDAVGEAGSAVRVEAGVARVMATIG